jgi:hypothetical protein
MELTPIEYRDFFIGGGVELGLRMTKVLFRLRSVGGVAGTTAYPVFGVSRSAPYRRPGTHFLAPSPQYRHKIDARGKYVVLAMCWWQIVPLDM